MRNLLILSVCLLSFLPATADELRIGQPGTPWTLVLSDPGFRFDSPVANHRGDRTWAIGEDTVRNMRLMVRMEKHPAAGSTGECRNYYWKRVIRNPLPTTGLKFHGKEGMEIAEYVTLGYTTDRPNRKHVHGFLSRDGVCIDIHIVQAPHEPTQRKYFLQVLESVRIVDEELRAAN